MKLSTAGLLMVLLLFLNACSAGKKTNESKIVPVKELKIFPYDLSKGTTFNLPDELEEISGLSLSENKDQLVAIQDENGILFFINKKTGVVEKTIDFKNDGDYEGITYAYGKYFILKSSGTIYEMILDDKEPSYKKHKYQLSDDTDHEGITYDPIQDKLVIACKDSKGLQEVDNNTRCLFTIDIKSLATRPQPYIFLTRESVKTYLLENLSEEQINKSFSKIFDESLEYLHLGPSGIAINPLSGNFYLLSAKGKLLVIVNKDGKLLKVIKFDKTKFPQPEGIVFDTDGTMYISSEKDKNETAVLSVFKVQD